MNATLVSRDKVFSQVAERLRLEVGGLVALTGYPFFFLSCAFRLAVIMLHCLPRYRQWSATMAERMNRDLVFDHTDAARDLGFKPRIFSISSEDIAR